LREAIGIAAQICDALHALHEGGIIHRDLKPENIMLVAGKEGATVVKLLDFGVVKFLPLDPTGGSREAEKPGTFVGTPRYMAPEQAAGATVDRRADLFSIGVILFEMITGRCPHEGDSLRDVVLAKLKGAPRITVNREKEVLPQELTELVDACLQLKPALRPGDARGVRDGLREAEFILFAVGPIRLGDDGTHKREAPAVPTTTPPKVEPPPPPPRPSPSPPEPRNPPKRRTPPIAIAIAVVISAFLLALAIRAMRRPDDSVLVLPEEPSAPEKRDVRIVTVPPGASVEIGETRYGPTPVTIALAPGPVRISMPGFRSIAVEVTADGPSTITATLTSTATRSGNER
jgi:serine/threonine-protein kinase